MRISDWSSDVCSSDLLLVLAALPGRAAAQAAGSLPPLEAAVEICHGLLPGFVRWPRDLEVVTQPGPGDVPTGVSLSLREDHADRSERHRVGTDCVRSCRSR